MSENATRNVCSFSDYLWLMRRVEDDKFPLLYEGEWISENRALEILREYEKEYTVMAETTRKLQAKG